MQPSPPNKPLQPEGGAVTAPPRLLVVDDEPSVRRVCGFALRAEGWKVETEGDSRGALVRLVDGDRFDVLVLDYAMPGLDGLGFLRELEHERGAQDRPPVILASAHADGAVAAEALRLGVWDFLAKPFTPEELRRSVRGLLGLGAGDPTGTSTLKRALGHARRREWSEARASLMSNASSGGLTRADGESRALIAGLLAEIAEDGVEAARCFHAAHWPADWRRRGPEIWIELARRLAAAGA